MRIDEVREHLRDHAATVVQNPAPLDEVYGRTVRAARRRRASRAVAAFVTVVIVGVGAATAVVAGSGRSPSSRVATPAAPTTRTPEQRQPLTTDQLDGHDGVGVPRGWKPVDSGGGRIWVPSTWLVETGHGACVLLGEPTSGAVNIDSTTTTCRTGAVFAQPEQSVSFVPSAASPGGSPFRTVHGYAIYLANVATAADRTYTVPALGVRLSFRSSLAQRILGTLGPSSQKVALAFASQPAVPGYRDVSTSGVSFSIPRAWTIATPARLPCRWPLSATHSGEVVRLSPTFSFDSCLQEPPQGDLLPHDGLILYTAEGAFQKQLRRGPILATLTHGSTTVQVFAGTESFFLDTLTLYVRNSPSSTTHVLVLGLGRDGRIAGGVLASIRAK